MNEYGAITVCMPYKCAFQNQGLKLAYLAYGYKTKSSIIKQKFFSVNVAFTRRIDLSPSVIIN